MNYNYYANYTDEKGSSFDYRISNAKSVTESNERAKNLAENYGWKLNYTFESLV